MIRIQTKPIILESWLWDEKKSTFKEIGCRMLSSSGHSDDPDLMQSLKIETNTGNCYVKKGEYIIKNIRGEYFVVNKEFFKTNYNILTD